jgi:hypothetical protein
MTRRRRGTDPWSSVLLERGEDVGLKAGSRLRSATDSTEVVVIKAPSGDVDLRCGGHPMLAAGADASAVATIEPGFDGGSLVGKRYADVEDSLEVLCTKGGPASISIGEDPLPVKGAKPLPSSD